MKTMINEMVNRFLGWKLPANFSPDAGMKFVPGPLQQPDGPYWPSGTNLLDATQARQMFEHCTSGPAVSRLIDRLHAAEAERDDLAAKLKLLGMASRQDVTGSWDWLRTAISEIPVRIEPISGQMHSYVQLDEVLGWIDEGERRSAGARKHFALVPKRMTREMEATLAEEGWEWADLLAAAEAITESEYAQINADEQMTSASHDVLAERRRQIDTEDWSPEDDDEHVNDEIAALACFYAMPPGAREWSSFDSYGDTLGEAILPDGRQATTGDRRRELVKAGALILAEIERLDRAEALNINDRPAGD